jgi:hypothetical protein
MRRSLFLLVQHGRIEALGVRARVALAAAGSVSGSERGELLAEVRRDARRLRRESSGHAAPTSRMLLAGVAALSGDLAEAVRLCREAEHGFEAADMRLCEKIAARRRGQLLKGDQGDDLMADADTWMSAHGVRDPERMSDVFAPGFI